jgi:hypothetical protein
VWRSARIRLGFPHRGGATGHVSIAEEPLRFSLEFGVCHVGDYRPFCALPPTDDRLLRKPKKSAIATRRMMAAAMSTNHPHDCPTSNAMSPTTTATPAQTNMATVADQMYFCRSEAPNPAI